MLLWLTDWLSQYVSFFGVFRYVTFRSVVAGGTAMAVSLIVAPHFIRFLTNIQVRAVIREDGPESHASKAGTPTMGGLFILLAVFVSTLAWGDLTNRFVWVGLATLASFGFIGWLDDYLKASKKSPHGLTARTKFLMQAVAALAIALYLYLSAQSAAELNYIVPFLKEVAIPLSFGFVVITFLMLVGMSNSVNLTDGLDGLAILPVVLVCGALGLIAYLTGHVEFSDYLDIPYLIGTSELTVLCAAVIGAGLGFLWYNAFPASIWMGDVGSLSLGAFLAAVAVMVRHELVLLIMGGLFVIETISVITQVGHFKVFGSRIFRMAPIHHHFELKGWPESHVIVRFWILSLIFVMVGLATLKIR